MGLCNLEVGMVKLPLFDLATLASGFYIGYQEGKGIQTNQTVEYVTKYGPTGFALVATPFLQKSIKTVGMYFLSQAKKAEKTEQMLNPAHKSENSDQLNTLEDKLNSISYMKPTVIMGVRTGIQTTVGYVAGRVLSHYF
jgi:hypothetical protein